MFIVIEGIDGAGKSTLIENLFKELRAIRPIIKVREPGSDPTAERIRKMLKSEEELTKRGQALLFQAARAQTVENVIVPALADGFMVLCDRYTYSTIAYQGAGDGNSIYTLASFNQFATDGLEPDLVLLLDIDPETANKRLAMNGSKADPWDQQSLDYFQRVRSSYIKQAANGQVIRQRNPDNPKWVILDASQNERELTLGALAHIMLFKKVGNVTNKTESGK